MSSVFQISLQFNSNSSEDYNLDFHLLSIPGSCEPPPSWVNEALRFRKRQNMPPSFSRMSPLLASEMPWSGLATPKRSLQMTTVNVMFEISVGDLRLRKRHLNRLMNSPSPLLLHLLHLKQQPLHLMPAIKLVRPIILQFPCTHSPSFVNKIQPILMSYAFTKALAGGSLRRKQQSKPMSIQNTR